MIGNLTPSIVGETPNLAARLQTIAKPNMVVISEVHGGFSGICLSSRISVLDLKGLAAPVQVWACSAGVLDEPLRGAPSKRDDDTGRPRGRVRILRRRWLKAKDGESQTVLLSGEAGIGKSHLTVAFPSVSRVSASFASVVSAPRNTRTARFILSSTM